MVTVRHAPTSAGEVRRQLGADLARRGLSADVVDDVTLLASELVGNSVRYAQPLPGGVLRVAWSVQPGSVQVRVTDGGGRGSPHVRDAGPSDVRGRGLAIVEALARDWGVDRAGHGPAPAGAASTVWAELALQGWPGTP
jgi:serine/threonine-protein kinase RsbW